MKRLCSTTIALIVGCVLAWLSVHLSGILSAQAWPAFVIALSKSSKWEALYFWGVAVHLVPMFLALSATGYVFFRVVGASTATLLASVLPYILLDWVLGSSGWLFAWPGFATYGLFLMGQLAFPLGLLVAWQLVRRGHSTPQLSVRRPAAFAS